jgi:hypothetical protein
MEMDLISYQFRINFTLNIAAEQHLVTLLFAYSVFTIEFRKTHYSLGTATPKWGITYINEPPGRHYIKCIHFA